MAENLSCYASGEELASFAIDHGMSVTEVKHAQVCYLYHVANVARKEISEITGYAVSTLSTLRNKVLDLLDVAKRLFTGVKEKVVKTVHKSATISINFLNGCGADIDHAEQVYLFKFYGAEPVPIFSKIGTTTRTCKKRVAQEIRAYIKAGFDIQRVDVCKIIQCGEMPAESYESFLRAKLIKEYSNTWVKNDRFFGVDLPVDRFITLCNQFIEG